MSDPTARRPSDSWPEPDRDELEAAFCWEAEDRVPGRPAMTAYRRRLRLRQARWRSERGYPIGTEPIVARAGDDGRPVGSRLPLAWARETGATFMTSGALAAARAREAAREPHQSLDHQRHWADLLWSSAFAINLFGDLAVDATVADRALHAWVPDAPGTVRTVRFAYSPGRLDPTWLNSLRQFDAAFVLDLADGTQGVVGIATRLHERAKPETPKPENLWRYHEVAGRSGVFTPDAIEALSDRTVLWEPWLIHLLLLSMLQHRGGAWTWGRFLWVYPAGNLDMDDICTRYRAHLVDPSTFGSMTAEAVLDTGALSANSTRLLRDRYLGG